MFENTTRLSENHISVAVRLKMKTTGIIVYRIVLAFLALLLGFFGVVSMGSPNGILYLLFAFVLFMFAIGGVFALLKSRMMKAIRDNERRTYTLKDKGITIRGVDGAGTGNKAIPYSEFDRLYLDGNDMYLRLIKGKQFLIMDGDGFTKGTAEDVIEFLKNKGLEVHTFTR